MQWSGAAQYAMPRASSLAEFGRNGGAHPRTDGRSRRETTALRVACTAATRAFIRCDVSLSAVIPRGATMPAQWKLGTQDASRAMTLGRPCWVLAGCRPRVT
jgi:hypothetical protein